MFPVEVKSDQKFSHGLSSLYTWKTLIVEALAPCHLLSNIAGFPRKWKVNQNIVMWPRTRFKMSAPAENMPQDDLCEIEATVASGFEDVVKEDVEEKFKTPVDVKRGRVVFKIPQKDVKKVKLWISSMLLPPRYEE